MPITLRSGSLYGIDVVQASMSYMLLAVTWTLYVDGGDPGVGFQRISVGHETLPPTGDAIAIGCATGAGDVIIAPGATFASRKPCCAVPAPPRTFPHPAR